MTKKLEISRELAERFQAFLDEAFDGGLEGILQEDCGNLIEELRALLAVPPLHPIIKVLNDKDQMELVALKATVAQQAQMIEYLKASTVVERQEPVAIIRKVVTDTSTGYEGVVLATAIISGLVEDGTKLYASPPPPVAVVLSLRNMVGMFHHKAVTPLELETIRNAQACLDKVKELNQ